MEEILHQLRLVVYPFLPWFTRVFSFLHPNGACLGFLPPSTVWCIFSESFVASWKMLIRVHHSAKSTIRTPDQQKGASSIHNTTEELSTSMCFVTNQVSTFNMGWNSWWFFQMIQALFSGILWNFGHRFLKLKWRRSSLSIFIVAKGEDTNPISGGRPFFRGELFVLEAG